MRLLKTAFDFYLDASVHVALSVISLYAITIELFQLPYNLSLMAFIGLSTIVGYNFVKYGVEAEKYLIVSNSYHKRIQAFSFICFGFAVYFALQLRFELLLAIGLLGLLSVFYALPVLPKAKNLRSLGIIKIFIVALVWAGITVLLPFLDSYQHLSWNSTLISIQRFLLVMALMLPFEVRDMAYDDVALKTIPQRVGVGGTKRLGLVLMALFFALTFFKEDGKSTEIISRLLVTVAVCVFLVKTKKQQSTYFSSFWVESIPIFWLMVLLILENSF